MRAMPSAWSPMRSMSVVIMKALMTARRSVAIGCWGGNDEDGALLDVEALLIDGGIFVDDALGPLEVG